MAHSAPFMYLYTYIFCTEHLFIIVIVVLLCKIHTNIAINTDVIIIPDALLEHANFCGHAPDHLE